MDLRGEGFQRSESDCLRNRQQQFERCRFRRGHESGEHTAPDAGRAQDLLVSCGCRSKNLSRDGPACDRHNPRSQRAGLPDRILLRFGIPRRVGPPGSGQRSREQQVDRTPKIDQIRPVHPGIAVQVNPSVSIVCRSAISVLECGDNEPNMIVRRGMRIRCPKSCFGLQPPSRIGLATTMSRSASNGSRSYAERRHVRRQRAVAACVISPCRLLLCGR